MAELRHTAYAGSMVGLAQIEDAPPPSPDWADAAEARVLDAAIRLAETRPWDCSLVLAAAVSTGMSEADVELLLPGGARDLAALLSRRHDAHALQRLSVIDAQTLRVRERVRIAVEARIEAAMVDEAAVRRASLYLARPANANLALRLAWESADGLWRWAGDASTDENHYSKRMILAGVMISTLAARLSLGRERATAYLVARIGDVMAFERFKAGLPRASEGLSGLAALLGRLRYR